MSRQDQPAYEGLKARCNDLQGQIIHFSRVEQELINARDRLDRELARFKAIESYNTRASQAKDMVELARITAETLIEAFDTECSAIFELGDGDTLRPLAAVDLAGLGMDRILEAASLLGKAPGEIGKSVVIRRPSPLEILGRLGLSQVIYALYHHLEGQPMGVVLGGISREKEVYYPEITGELAPSFSVFARQAGIAFHGMEYRHELERRVREKTAELQAANQKLASANESLQREIEERKRVEAALRESERRFRTLTDTATDAIIMMDGNGRVSYWNPAAETIFGYSAGEAMGEDLHSLLAKRGCHGGMGPRLARFRDTGRDPFVGKTIQMVASTKKGGRVPIEISISSVKINGTWHGIGIARDVTDRVKMEKELLRIQKMESLGVLAGGIAHDFNNLLMGIQGNISLMALELAPSHPHYKRLKSIEKVVQSGAQLTSQLLGYARKGKYEVMKVDLNHLVAETSQAFGRTRKDISIHLDLAPDLCSIMADRTQVEQVLWNLFVNASDAMPGGGRLSLATRNTSHREMHGRLYRPAPGEYVSLTVTDTGQGMDRDVMERIFDPFFTTKEMGRGTGLGLASVYGIIKNHNGYIDVESEVGNGTTFRIFLPSSGKVREDEEDGGMEGRRTGAWGRSGTVLLVDDEQVILNVGKEFLEVLGFDVLAAGSGKEALEVYQARKDEIDIVLLDMIMPEMGGGEVYDHLKEIDPGVKVLLSSGYSIDGAASEIMSRGCNDFIQKPFDINELARKIEGILKG